MALLPLLESLIPPSFFLTSVGIFFIIILSPTPPSPFPYHLSASLLLTAVLSLHTSRNLSWLPADLNVLWALLICIWILHSTATLYIDRPPLPLNRTSTVKERLKYAYKAFNDPRRQIVWFTFPSSHRQKHTKRNERQTQTRTRFLLSRLHHLALHWLFHTLLIEPLTLLLFTSLTAADFAPDQRVFIRNLLLPGSNTNNNTITPRALLLRTCMSLSWIWLSFLLLDSCHIILSILFVTVLRLDEPVEWERPLFGELREGHGVRRFWGRFWHGITVPGCRASGRVVFRAVAVSGGGAGMGIGVGDGYAERVFVVFWTFFVSGVCHGVAGWQAGGRASEMAADVLFFTANFVAGMIEKVVVDMVDKELSKKKGSGLGIRIIRHIVESEVGKKTVGFAWVFGFFFWIVPKWQYGKFYALLSEIDA